MKFRDQISQPEFSIVLLKNVIDTHGNPVGHCRKQLLQSYTILRKMGYAESQIEIVATREVLCGIPAKRKVILPFATVAKGNDQMHETAQIVGNYLVSRLLCHGKRLWYVFLSEQILTCLVAVPTRKYLMGTTFRDWSCYLREIDSDIRRWGIQKGLRRLNLCIATNRQYRPDTHSIWLPDYYCTSKQKSVRGAEKSRYVLCLGEMRANKGVTKLIRVFEKNDVDIKLVIKGAFTDSNARRVLNRRYRNIEIEDVNLSDDKYLEEMAKAQYIVLPYDMSDYRSTTSGVLLESVFVGGIPIAPSELLQNHRIAGIGYRNILEIPSLIRAYEEKDDSIQNDLEDYELENMSVKLKKAIEGRFL